MVGRSLRSGITVLAAVSLSMAGIPGAARADVPNTVTAFIQPVRNCSISFIGNLVCAGPTEPVMPISPGATNASANPVLGVGMGYRVCWITAAGQTVPTGAICTAGTTSLTAPRPDFHVAYPITFSGTPRNGCGGIATPNGDDVMLFVNDLAPCTLTITAPDAPGFSATQATYAFAVGPARAPLLMGPLATSTETTGRVGGSSTLQEVTCRYMVQTLGDFKSGCEGVVLNWTVLTGRRACRLVEDEDMQSQTLGSVSVRFLRPGTCTVRGSYPAVPGASEFYQSPVYTFTVHKRKRPRPHS